MINRDVGLRQLIINDDEVRVPVNHAQCLGLELVNFSSDVVYLKSEELCGSPKK